MRGIELSRKFYDEYGSEMIRTVCPEYENRIAVGIAGSGSECFGFDDEISRDHDFCAGFCLWLTREDEEKIGFKLMRAYNRLPKEFDGIKIEAHSYLGTSKFGVKTIDEFLRGTIGLSSTPQSWQEWFYLPDYALAQAVNGEVFRDDLGEFSAVRTELKNMPRDVFLKKLAAHLALAAQAGQYNFPRCIAHSESGAAQLAAAEFVSQILFTVFMLNGEYLPYYKWRFRALKGMKKFSEIGKNLETLLTVTNDENNVIIKNNIIESVCAKIAEELKSRGFSSSDSDYLENHALSVTSKISSAQIKALHLMDYGE